MQTTTTTTKKVTEYASISNRGSSVDHSSAFRSTYAMPSYSIFKDSSSGISSGQYVSSSEVGGLYGPGSRPERLTSEKRSLSGSSLSAAVSIRDSREREKKEICDLNDRFANYIEKVRFLDAQNRKMINDLEVFRARVGKDTMSTKAMFECEISEARKLIKVTDAEREELLTQIPKLEAEIAEYRKKYADALEGHNSDKKRIDDLIVTFTGIENESNLMRRRVAELEEEVGNLKKINISDSNMLSRIRTDVDQESLSRLDYQNRLQMLIEEIDFTKHEHEQEVMDLQAAAVHDTTPENREYFRTELAGAIREIRAKYDQVMVGYRSDIDSWYELKVRELYTSSNRQNIERGYTKQEVTRLRKQMGDLRGRLADFEARNALLEKQQSDMIAQMKEDQQTYEMTLKQRDEQVNRVRQECDAITVELQNLLDQKQSLEAEIEQYRKLLEGEESRAGLRKVLQSKEIGDIIGGGGASSNVYTTTSLTKSSAGSMGGGGVSLLSATAQTLSSSATAATTTTTTTTTAKSTSVIKSQAERLSQESGELTSKIYYKGTAKGNVSIKEASIDGKYILLENTSLTADENIGKWQLVRKVDDKPEVTFTFSEEFILKAGRSVKVWAHCAEAVNDPPNQIIDYKTGSFQTGMNAKTQLINTKGEERAVHTQSTTQSTVIYA